MTDSPWASNITILNTYYLLYAQKVLLGITSHCISKCHGRSYFNLFNPHRGACISHRGGAGSPLSDGRRAVGIRTHGPLHHVQGVRLAARPDQLQRERC